MTCALITLSACGGKLDAGNDKPHGLLPVDERNPVIIDNDGSTDNWQGEYALLFASSGSPPLAGIIVNSSNYWPTIGVNMTGWTDLVAAARASGMRNIPDPTESIGPPLAMPADGNIDSTVPNQSAGAKLIVDASLRLSLSYRPLVVVTGGQLTDVADAYLVDHTVADRVVVVSALGTSSSTGGAMGTPNGDLDPWADRIVAERFQYVQVSAFYDQATDVPSSMLTLLPKNALGTWIASKQPNLQTVVTAADQVGIIAVELSTFAVDVQHVSADTTGAIDSTAGPMLVPDPMGHCWLVTGIVGTLAPARFWQMLLDPTTYGQ